MQSDLHHRPGTLGGVDALVTDMAARIRLAGLSELPMLVPHAQKAGSWPRAHCDPFDRRLAAQGALEDLPLVTQDPAFKNFGIGLVW